MKSFHLNLLTITLTMAIGASEGRAATLAVCARTPAVKTFLQGILKKPCTEISETDLLAVKRVDVSHRGIKEFLADDFSGLANLEILNIRSNPYTEFPEGLFKDLVNLKTIVIIGTSLRHFPDDFLLYNLSIENLHAFRNQVRSISESVLQRLEAARGLKNVDFDRALQSAEKARLERFFPNGGSVELNLI